ncbi:LysR family transcriptional regulator [Mesobacterium pallidum]|uniref:LysR family transcriptional regulator n=1 Tax=Mesobacterium pallidum TaxID=2872037 RepID=UPI001EE2B2BE|nr:LysR family transcriptional regulator [Mesobacterium pallidum]
MKSAFGNWSDVRVFLAVLRSGSTLAASRGLGMAQPTVARRIDALEHETGLVLFERDTRGFHPTSAAAALAPQAEAMERAAIALAEAAADCRQSKPILITAFSKNFSPRITAIFSDFAMQHPGIRLEFLSSTRILDLMAGEADVALRISRSDPDPELIQRKISTAQFALYGARSYAREHGLPSGPEDYARHRFVSFVRRDVPAASDTWLRSHVPPDRIVTTFSEFEMMDMAVRGGAGLGVINLRLAEMDPDLIRCSDPIPELAARHQLLVSPDAYRRPEVRLFVSFFAPRYAEIFRTSSTS